jgi:hypothetical protein
MAVSPTTRSLPDACNKRKKCQASEGEREGRKSSSSNVKRGELVLARSMMIFT